MIILQSKRKTRNLLNVLTYGYRYMEGGGGMQYRPLNYWMYGYEVLPDVKLYGEVQNLQRELR